MTSFQLKLVLFLSAYMTYVNSVKLKDSFNEELFMKPLVSGHMYSYFQFTTIWEVDDHIDQYFTNSHLFPRPLGEFIKSYDIKEMHISLTEGLWRHKTWGYPVVEAGPGAEIWVWFNNGTQNVDQKWKDLVNSLSGLFCATLNFMEKSNSLSPQLSLRPTGVFKTGEKLDNSNIRYSSLPREIVCTENLTPWMKLLPCDGRKGLATLLNSKNLHNTNYHSLGISYRHICLDKACTRFALELKQTVSLIHDMIIIGAYDFNWSIRKLFGNGVASSCSLADTSAVYVDVTTSNSTGPVFTMEPTPTKIMTSLHGGQTYTIAFYDLHKLNKILNVYATYEKPRVVPVTSQPILFTHRYITGYGQERGGIVTKIFNRHRTPLQIIYLENIPWFAPIYYHTLKIVSGNKEIKPKLKKYIPGKARLRPYYLEVLLEIPERAVTTISIDFDYMFLKWQEYPPDANHGFYIGSAIITAMLPNARNYTALPQTESLILNSFNMTRDSYMVQLRTEALIITLPTPDFSMPYNVICLACTVVALAFGPLHNIATKRLRLTVSKRKTIFEKCKRFILKLISNFRSKDLSLNKALKYSSGEEEEEEEEVEEEIDKGRYDKCEEKRKLNEKKTK